jgi:hypothetical protein
MTVFKPENSVNKYKDRERGGLSIWMGEWKMAW